MRRVLLAVIPPIMALAGASSVAALDRLPNPVSDGQTLVSRVADLDRPAATYRARRAVYPHWRYRAAYVRWMHNEYVNAGYPVRHRQYRTYARVFPCCYYGRRW